MKSMGIYSIDFYAYTSGLREWNPGFKAAVSTVVLLLCIIAGRPVVSVWVLVSTGAVTVGMGGLSLRKYLNLLKIPLAFLVMGGIAVAVGFSRSPYGDAWIHLHWFYLYVAWDGISTAFNLTLKALGAVSAMYMLVLSTPASEIIGVLRRLYVPKLVIELMNMIYRFIFVLMDTQCRMKLAAQSRLGYCDFKTSCRSFGSTAGNLFVMALKKANLYYDALISRCYDGQLLFLEEEKPVKMRQIVAACGYVLILVLVWVLI